MQFDYMNIFFKYMIYTVILIIALIFTLLARNHFVRSQSQENDDSDKLETPTYEEMNPGIQLSEPEDND
jgi:hypothetical protein